MKRRADRRGRDVLLELPARRDSRARQLSFVLAVRGAGGSRGIWRKGVQLLHRGAALFTGRMMRFAVVGAVGTVVNLVVLALLVHGLLDINYVLAAVVAAEVSILHNFVLQERFVFGELQKGANSRSARLAQHLLFNNAEALVRLPLLVLLVETMHALALLAQAVTLAIAFVARFLFASRVIYRPTAVAGHTCSGTRATEVSA